MNKMEYAIVPTRDDGFTDAELHRDEFLSFRDAQPRNELIKMLDFMFLAYDESIKNGEPDRAKYIGLFIKHNMALLEKNLEGTADLKQQILLLEQLWAQSGIRIPENTLRVLNDALKDGSLLKKNVVSRYIQLQHQYVLSRAESKSLEIPVLFNTPSPSELELKVKCISAYRYLYQNHFKFLSRGGRGLLVETINELRHALKEGYAHGARLAIDRARTLMKPMTVYHLRNVKDGITDARFVEIAGIGHPFIDYSIEAENGTKSWSLPNFSIGGDGRFQTGKIKLIGGSNKIKLSPMEIPELLFDNKLILEVSIKKVLSAYLSGLIDGPTKKILAEVSVKEIILCSNPRCKNYSLRSSWDAFNGCPICSHKGYYGYDHDNFELE